MKVMVNCGSGNFLTKGPPNMVSQCQFMALRGLWCTKLAVDEASQCCMLNRLHDVSQLYCQDFNWPNLPAVERHSLCRMSLVEDYDRRELLGALLWVDVMSEDTRSIQLAQAGSTLHDKDQITLEREAGSCAIASACKRTCAAGLAWS